MRLDKWAVTAQEALQAAVGIATDANASELTPLHLLKALLSSGEHNLSAIIERVGADPRAIESQVDAAIARQPRVSGDASQPGVGNDLVRVANAAEKLATKLGDSYVTTEHLLCALADDKTDAGSILKSAGITGKRVEAAYSELRGDERVTSQDSKTEFEALSKYGRNVCDLARQGKLDPVIGRVEEIRRTIQVLSRRTKNNPVLIGEPGVGKTAIAEGLAQRIAEGNVPYKLRDKQVYLLDLTALVAGTQFRGQFESRMKGLIEEIRRVGNIILVIDEVHNIVGAGDAEGSMNAANILKPALSRGEIQVIGATTFAEYRKYIEKDSALERRFQPVMVKQPGVEDTISILRGLKERYEVHHGVRIKDAALVAAAVMSNRYINDRFLPDKAIDLVDEAAARLRTEIDSLPAALDESKRRILQLEIEAQALGKEQDEQSKERLVKIEEELSELRKENEELVKRWDGEKASIARVREVKKEIDAVKQEMEGAERSYDLNKLAELKYGRLPALEKELAEVEANNKNDKENRGYYTGSALLSFQFFQS